jgi:hypothetical protein
MLTATNHAFLLACRAKRYRLTEAQRQTKKITRAPHPPAGCAAAQRAENLGAGAITALHIIEAEIRGLKPAHKETSTARYPTLWQYRGRPEEAEQAFWVKRRAEFDAWLLT